MSRSSFTPHSAVGPPSPTVFAVDDRHRHGVEVEIVEQPELTPTFGLSR